MQLLSVFARYARIEKFTWRSTNCPPKTYISSFNVAAHDATTWVVSPWRHWYGPYVKSKSASSCPEIDIKFSVVVIDSINLDQILLTIERGNHWNIVWVISTQHKHCWFLSNSKCWKMSQFKKVFLKSSIDYWQAKSNKVAFQQFHNTWSSYTIIFCVAGTVIWLCWWNILQWLQMKITGDGLILCFICSWACRDETECSHFETYILSKFSLNDLQSLLR